jgi:hypothetical protein
MSAVGLEVTGGFWGGYDPAESADYGSSTIAG